VSGGDALLDAIARDPEDPAPYLVYADWLQARGEPRGELIALQGAGDDHPGDHRITDAALDHLRAHAASYLGALAPFVGEPDGEQYLDLRWRHGFIGSAALHAWGRSRRHSTFELLRSLSPAQALAELLQLESARFLTRLSIGPHYDDRNGQFVSDVLTDIAVPSLRSLWLGTSGWLLSPWSFELGDLGPIWQRMSGLRELVVHALPTSFGALDLPALRTAVFAITPRVVPPTLLRELATARWPRLESLQLWHGDAVALGGVVLERSDLVTLGDLGLHNCAAADGVCELLARSPLAPQLHRLSFARSAFTDAGAVALLTHREAFPNLTTLDLCATCVSPESVRRLAAVVPTVIARDLRMGSDVAVRLYRSAADDDSDEVEGD
jgi:uncharacterized protein (TIGR02996 family)